MEKKESPYMPTKLTNYKQAKMRSKHQNKQTKNGFQLRSCLNKINI